MGYGQNDDRLRALASILGSSEASPSVPTLRPPAFSPSYPGLASLFASAPTPFSSLYSTPSASTVPTGSTPSTQSGLLTALLAVPLAPQAVPPSKWIYVTRRFDRLIDAIGIQQEEIDEGLKKLGRVIASLNRCYWNHSSETLNAILVGSWGKQTRVRPFSDIDVMFVLPRKVYWRFDKRLGNKQSQLLQEVRTNLKVTYPRTDIRGDGQVVIVNVDGVTIEVVPAFRFDDGKLFICDANADGRYKWADPAAELQTLENADSVYNTNARQRCLR